MSVASVRPDRRAFLGAAGGLLGLGFDLRAAQAEARQSRFRNIREVPSVPVRCIQVDSPSHLYLAGRACVPTSPASGRTGPERPPPPGTSRSPSTCEREEGWPSWARESVPSALTRPPAFPAAEDPLSLGTGHPRKRPHHRPTI